MTMVDSGIRARKKAETRRRLVAAARELALANGPDHVTVEEIAQRGDVSVRTFFNYFASRDEALVGIDESAHERIRVGIQNQSKKATPAEALVAALIPSEDDDADTTYLWRLRAQLVRESPALRGAHRAALYRLAETGAAALRERYALADSDPLPEVLAGALIGVLAAYTDRLADEPTLSFRTAVQDAIATLKKALR